MLSLFPEKNDDRDQRRRGRPRLEELPEIRERAVACARLVRGGAAVKVLARHYGVSVWTIRRWIERAREWNDAS